MSISLNSSITHVPYYSQAFSKLFLGELKIIDIKL